MSFRDSGDQTSGQFALCALCWRISTPDERVAAHRTITFSWREDRHDEWPAIELAVRYAEDITSPTSAPRDDETERRRRPR